jgi:hypothetical protein
MSIAIEDISVDDARVAFVEARPVGWAGFVKVEDFHEALKAQGVPEKLWPSKPTNNKRLERAIKAQKDSRRVLIRPLAKGKGWSLVTEAAEELELEGEERHKTAHSVDLTCTVKTVNDTPYVESTPWDHERVPSIKQDFTYFEDVFKCSEDLSQWFSRTIIPWCRGVATRSRGGTYYVLKGANLERLKNVADALDTVSTSRNSPFKVSGKTINVTTVHNGGRIILKPEVASETAVEILMDNFISECELVATTVGNQASNTKLGHRALTTQKDSATTQIDKLTLLEDVLDTKLDKLRDKLGEAKDEVGMAALAALAKEDEKKK